MTTTEIGANLARSMFAHSELTSTMTLTEAQLTQILTLAADLGRNAVSLAEASRRVYAAQRLNDLAEEGYTL